jgi:UDP-N-acetylmuramate-alanine ligase
VVHRAGMLAELAQGRRCVAVTGTSGKTTVTGMIGWIMEQLGTDPTVVNGGVVLDWQAPDAVGNVRAGHGDWWIVEADESDKSLLNFAPDWAVITNVSKDHFELEEVIALFRDFCAKVGKGIVAGSGVREILKLPGLISPPIAPSIEGGAWKFNFKELVFTVPAMGRHNAENAAMAVALCDKLGLPLDGVRDALARFRGIHRRLESVGTRRGVRVIDDYAHNPAKISASWKAVAESAQRILGFWRPHGFGPLALMKDEVADALASVCRPQDQFFVLPVFYVGGTASRSYTSEDFVHLLQSRGVPAVFAPDYVSLERQILASCREGDTVLAMGARDPELPRSARRIAQGL